MFLTSHLYVSPIFSIAIVPLSVAKFLEYKTIASCSAYTTRFVRSLLVNFSWLADVMAARLAFLLSVITFVGTHDSHFHDTLRCDV